MVLPSKKSKFQCVVHWTESNQVSIVPLDCVIDEEMINDPEKEGLIHHGAVGGHPPEGGWTKYPGKVLLCSGESDKQLAWAAEK